MTYEEVLKIWAKQRLLADKPELMPKTDLVVIFDVDVREMKPTGYCETCYSPGYIDIAIRYAILGEDDQARTHQLYAEDMENEYYTLTSLVRDLAAIAEEMESDPQG